jgi:hypothetical protein
VEALLKELERSELAVLRQIATMLLELPEPNSGKVHLRVEGQQERQRGLEPGMVSLLCFQTVNHQQMEQESVNSQKVSHQLEEREQERQRGLEPGVLSSLLCSQTVSHQLVPVER